MAKHPNIPDHLYSDCVDRELTGDRCRSAACADAVKQAPTGRWFITMGHPGFNSAVNNGTGYARESDARRDVTFYATLSSKVVRHA